PDVLVALGVGTHPRRSYRVWEEGTLPRVLFEVASENTWREDAGDKREVYERLGVAEYFLFDPERRFLDPPLQGYRLQEGAYVPLERDEGGGLTSEELGLRLVPAGRMLRLIDVRTGEPVLTRAERVEQEREQVERERQRAEQERQRAEQEREQAERERRRT